MFEKTRDHFLSVKPLAGVIGDEAKGIDLGGDLCAEAIFALQQALLEYGVIFSHDQYFEVAAHK